MTDRINNPRLSKEGMEEMLRLATSGIVPVHDEKNDGTADDDFIQIMAAAAEDRDDLGSYALKKPDPNRGIYPE